MSYVEIPANAAETFSIIAANQYTVYLAMPYSN